MIVLYLTSHSMIIVHMMSLDRLQSDRHSKKSENRFLIQQPALDISYIIISQLTGDCFSIIHSKHILRSRFVHNDCIEEHSRFSFQSDAKFFHIILWVGIYESGTIDLIIFECTT